MKILKSYLYNLLCNQLTGSLLSTVYNNRIPDLRWRQFRFQVNPRFVNRSITASIFWGFYEAAEIRFIEKYLDGSRDVIELGGSIGIVSSHILKKLQEGRKLVTVEANPALIETIDKNLCTHKKEKAAYKVLNNAVSYGSENIYINISGNNTESRISNESHSDSNSFLIPSITLGQILRQEQINEFTLVCDIEGSEIELLLNEDEAFKKCMQLFIELHDTRYQGVEYSVDRLKEILEAKHHFHLQDQHGAVCYFTRKP